MEKDYRLKNGLIDEAIEKLNSEPTKENLIDVLEQVRLRLLAGGDFYLPIDIPSDGTGAESFGLKKLKRPDGTDALAVFTCEEEANKGPQSSIIQNPISIFLQAVTGMKDITGVIINPWSGSFFLPKNMIEMILAAARPQNPDNHIYVERGDITKYDVDAIVNISDKSLTREYVKEIVAAAGKGLLEECRLLGGCETGGAKITKGYELKAPYVIHTVGPTYDDEEVEWDKELLGKCYWNTLTLAKSYNIHSLAFPCGLIEKKGLTEREAAQIALVTISRWLDANKDYGMAVVLVCANDNIFSTINKLIEDTKKEAEA